MNRWNFFVAHTQHFLCLKNDEENILLSEYSQVNKINDGKMLFCFKLISFRSLSLHLTPPILPSLSLSLLHHHHHTHSLLKRGAWKTLLQHRVDRIINDSKWKTNKHSLLSLNPCTLNIIGYEEGMKEDK